MSETGAAHAARGGPTAPLPVRIGVVTTVVLLVAVAVACRASDDGPSSASTSVVTATPPSTAATTTTSAATHGGTLSLGLEAAGGSLQPDALDPSAGRWTASELQLARLVYDRLAVYDAGHQLQPQLAASIEPSDDLASWTITLRDDVRFHDGTPVDAEAVRANLDAQRASQAFGPLLEPIVEIDVTDPLELVVHARAPWSTFPHVLAAQPGYVAAPGSLGRAVAPGTVEAVGSGPFLLEGAQPASGPWLVRNDAYWQPGVPEADAVRVSFVDGGSARLSDVGDGDLDVALLDEPIAVSRAAERGAEGEVELVVDVFAEPPKLTVVLAADRLPGLDPGARQAVAEATDREALAEVAWDAAAEVGEGTGPLDGLVRPAVGPVAEESVFFNGDPPSTRDASAALDTASAYAQRYGEVLAFTLLVPDEPPYRRVAAAWADQLAEGGIGVEIEVLPLDEVRRRLELGEAEAAMLPLFADWHPDLWYPSLHRSELTPVGVQGPNLARHGTAAIDKALDAARATGELALQVDEYRLVQAEVRAGGAYQFLVRLPQAVVAAPEVEGLTGWTTATGEPGLAFEGGTVALVEAWADRGGTSATPTTRRGD